MNQEEVLGRAIDAVEAAGLAYRVVGSFASSYHGAPRLTHDADVVVDADERGALDLCRRLAPDFYVSEEAALAAARSRRLFNAIHLESALEVDLIVKKARAFSDEELRRRQPGRLAGREVMFATPEDTILAKLESGRQGASERQYSDALQVARVQGGRLDWPYLERWAGALGVTEPLSRLRAEASP